MKCIVLLFALVAVCYSYPYGSTGGRSVNISEDGTIVITGTNGKRITITKGVGVGGQKHIEIAVSGPNIPTKRVQINEQNEFKGGNLLEYGRGQVGEFDVGDEYSRDKRSSHGRSQGDTLSEILRQYQGVVDDNAYDQLLGKVNAAVRSGLLSQSVYDILQTLGQTQYPGVGQVITGQGADVLDLLQRQQVQDLLQQQQYQQGSPLSALAQQQIAQQYGQRIAGLGGIGGRGIGFTLQGGVLPVGASQSQIERVLLGQSQAIPYSVAQGLIYGPGGISRGTVGGWRRSVWDNLLNSYGSQYQGIPVGQYGQQYGPLAQIVQTERAILDQTNQIQQQQVQQELQEQQQEQQILQQQQQQLQILQQQQQQQQWLQQLQQQQLQQELQQEQLQQQVWQQQQQQDQLQQQVQPQQYGPLGAYLLNRAVSAGQPGGVWQQLGVYPQRGLVGVAGLQGIPVTRRTVPLVI